MASIFSPSIIFATGTASSTGVLSHGTVGVGAFISNGNYSYVATSTLVGGTFTEVIGYSTLMLKTIQSAQYTAGVGPYGSIIISAASDLYLGGSSAVSLYTSYIMSIRAYNSSISTAKINIFGEGGVQISAGSTTSSRTGHISISTQYSGNIYLSAANDIVLSGGTGSGYGSIYVFTYGDITVSAYGQMDFYGNGKFCVMSYAPVMAGYQHNIRLSSANNNVFCTTTLVDGVNFSYVSNNTASGIFRLCSAIYNAGYRTQYKMLPAQGMSGSTYMIVGLYVTTTGNQPINYSLYYIGRRLNSTTYTLTTGLISTFTATDNYTGLYDHVRMLQ